MRQPHSNAMCIIVGAAVLFFLGWPRPLFAAKDFAVKNNSSQYLFVNGTSGNVGVGTNNPQTALAVTNGNVGIGTWTAAGGKLIISSSGNVGIGSAFPGAILDIQGNLRVSGTISGMFAQSSLEVTGQTTLNTSSANTGIGTTLTGGNTARLAVIGGNVGIGTVSPQGGFVVPYGNVGIGTFAPRALFDVTGNRKDSPFIIDSSGNVGIGTSRLTAAAVSIMNGNVGLGTWLPEGTFHAVTDNGINFIVSADGIRAGCSSNSVSNVGFAFGCSNTASGAYSLAGGESTEATGAQSAAFGYNTAATGDSSLAFGDNTIASGASSLAGGSSTTAAGVASMALGEGTIAATRAALAIGRFNIGLGTAASGQNWIASDPVLEIGIGTVNVPANALTVLKSGFIGIGTYKPAAHLNVNGSVGIGTAHSIYVRGSVLPPEGGMIVQGNVGLGTITPQAAFVSMGNVGIGTWTASGGNLIINGGGNVGIGTAWPGVALDVGGTARSIGFTVNGSLNMAVVSKTSGYTATTTDNTILVDASGGAVTITLPAAAGISGRLYTIKKTDSSGNNVVIDPNGAETIDGAATNTFNTQYQSVTVVCDGSTWWTI